eukprot:TRINITY_DN17579_c0_g1_i2.p1 TRINITY_DN17579_c0_g1~~TRINITY_DN17579_c0_g1_i2.p1  ORF type:complete len:129 (-),score=5.22 TRINITY_DN17579_c0_g1_i2:10-396(-)
MFSSSISKRTQVDSKDCFSLVIFSTLAISYSMAGHIMGTIHFLHLIKSGEPININDWTMLGMSLIIFIWIIVTTFTVCALTLLDREDTCKELEQYFFVSTVVPMGLSLIHICRCRRYAVCRSRWSPYH